MRVTVVDDNTTNLAVVCSVVSKIPFVDVEGLSDPLAALAKMTAQPADLIIVDYVMPEMNGIEFVVRARALPQLEHTPIIMLTADSERKLKQDALRAGANDFLNKPVDPLDLRARVTNLLALHAARRELATSREQTTTETDWSPHVLERLERVVQHLGGNDGTSETAEHVARIIAEEMGLSAPLCAAISRATGLRNIGMTAALTNLASSARALSDDEMAAIHQHCLIGAQIIGEDGPEALRVAHDIALYHHEHWDGRGYPRQLASADIPLPARIVAVADAFSAMTSARPFRPAMADERAAGEINRNSGTQFDPDCVAAFERGWPRIAATLNDLRLHKAA